VLVVLPRLLVDVKLICETATEVRGCWLVIRGLHQAIGKGRTEEEIGKEESKKAHPEWTNFLLLD